MPSLVALPKPAPTQFGPCYRTLSDDSPRDEPKQHKPADALEEEEHEPCHADGFQPLQSITH